MSKLYSLEDSPVFCSKVWGSNFTSPYIPKGEVSTHAEQDEIFHGKMFTKTATRLLSLYNFRQIYS